MFDRRRVAHDFGKAAAHYAGHASLQWRIGKTLIEHASPHVKPDALLLDVGAGSGEVTKLWPARSLALDAAFGMCMQVPGSICANAEALPMASESMDAVASNVMMQWLDEPKRFFAESFRVLKPGGLLAVSTFAHGTLAELHTAFGKAGEHHRLSDFIRPAKLTMAAEAAGFALIASPHELIREPYHDMLDLCFYLRDIGAANKRDNRPRGLLTLRKLREAASHYPRDAKGISASWAVQYVIARKV